MFENKTHPDIKVLNVVYWEHLESSVFPSQTKAIMKRLIEGGIDVKLIVIAGLSNYINYRKNSKYFTKLQNDLKGRIFLRITLERFGKGITRKILMSEIKKCSKKNKNLIIQSRYPSIVLWASQLKKFFPEMKVIYDIRGITAVETEYTQKKEGSLSTDIRKRIAHIDKVEKQAASVSDYCFMVSEGMKEYFCTTHGTLGEKTTILPCSVDEKLFTYDELKRIDKRKVLGLTDNIVFLYCGSAHCWQLPEMIIDLFRKIKSRIENAYLLILTDNIDYFSSACASLMKNSYSIFSVPHVDVPGYMLAADYGFLLRETSPLNYVSSPVKLGEYLCTGLPVISTDAINMLFTENFSALKDSILMLDWQKQSEWEERLNHFITRSRHLDRCALAEKGNTFFSRTNAVSKIKHIYCELTGIGSNA